MLEVNKVTPINKAEMLNYFDTVKYISVKWAIVTAIRDVDRDTVKIKPYEGWELKEERAAYHKKVNELRSKHEH